MQCISNVRRDVLQESTLPTGIRLNVCQECGGNRQSLSKRFRQANGVRKELVGARVWTSASTVSCLYTWRIQNVAEVALEAGMLSVGTLLVGNPGCTHEKLAR